MELVERTEPVEENAINFLNEKGKVIPYYLAHHLQEKHNVISDSQYMYTYNNGIYEALEPSAYPIINPIIHDKEQMRMSMVNEVTSLIRNETYRPTVEETRGYIFFKNGMFNVNTQQFEKATPKVICFDRMNHSFDLENMATDTFKS